MGSRDLAFHGDANVVSLMPRLAISYRPCCVHDFSLGIKGSTSEQGKLLICVVPLGFYPIIKSNRIMPGPCSMR